MRESYPDCDSLSFFSKHLPKKKKKNSGKPENSWLGVIDIWKKNSIKIKLQMLFVVFYYIDCLNGRIGIFYFRERGELRTSGC